MQNIKAYLSVKGVLGESKDSYNAKKITPPQLVKGCSTMLSLRLFTGDDSNVAYPIESLAGVVSWSFVLDSDYNKSTTPKIVADNANIRVVTGTDGEDNTPYTEVVIPILNMNTVELNELLKDSAVSKSLIGELVGYDSTGENIFVLQVEGFTIRNRVNYDNEPTELPEDYLKADQVRALIASGVVFEYSADGNSWHSTQSADDFYLRFRSASSATSAWSSPIKLLQGPQGNQGKQGKTPQISIGTVIKGDEASATISQVDENVTLNLTLPKGDKGNKGDVADISAGTVTTLAPSENATVEIVPNADNSGYLVNFSIPKGDVGEAFKIDATGVTEDKSLYDDQQQGFAFLDVTSGMLYVKLSSDIGDWSEPLPFKGEKGDAPTIEIGTVETLLPNQQATATVTQNGDIVTLNLGIPQGATGVGEKGDKGDTGSAPTVQVGTVQTLQPGSQATVTVSQSGDIATFSFGIPKGDTGDGSQDLTTVNQRLDSIEEQLSGVDTLLDEIIGA
jgi:hypothetical protein